MNPQQARRKTDAANVDEKYYEAENNADANSPVQTGQIKILIAYFAAAEKVVWMQLHRSVTQ